MQAGACKTTERGMLKNNKAVPPQHDRAGKGLIVGRAGRSWAYRVYGKTGTAGPVSGRAIWDEQGRGILIFPHFEMNFHMVPFATGSRAASGNGARRGPYSRSEAPDLEQNPFRFPLCCVRPQTLSPRSYKAGLDLPLSGVLVG